MMGGQRKGGLSPLGNNERLAAACTVCTIRCGYGAVVDGQGGPRVAGSSGLDAVDRRMRLTPRADQLNRGDAPMRLTLASPSRVFDVGQRGLEGMWAVGSGPVLFAKVSRRGVRACVILANFYNRSAGRLRVTRRSGMHLGGCLSCTITPTVVLCTRNSGRDRVAEGPATRRNPAGRCECDL